MPSIFLHLLIFKFEYYLAMIYMLQERALRKITSCELLAEGAESKKNVITHKKYVHTEVVSKLRRIESLVISGNTFLYLCVEEVCRL
jgi:hypothetical protein